MKRILGVKQKAIRIFNKNGGDGENIKLFKSFSPSQRERFLNACELEHDENPIIVGQNENGNVFLLSNKRIASFCKTGITFVWLAEISCVKLSEKLSSVDEKEKWKQLEVIDFRGKSHFFELESGKPFFGVWNILLFVSAHNEYYCENHIS